ncbi:hypothetical protein MP228_007585 [Amoeboaphelidium protococcarum]|nr:hypothetical protein MP228_007585 [Amoeboaphelidium protococcarum]
MFWRFGFQQTSSNIENLLDREGGCTLYELFREDELLQEVKTQNNKVIEFLCQENNLKQIITWLCGIPETEVEQNELLADERFKFPFVASEILCCETNAFINELVDSHMEFMDILYSIIDTEQDINPVNAGYFNKVVGTLLVKRTHETLQYLRQKQNCVQQLLRHACTFAIGDVILKIVACDTYEEGHDITGWLSEAALIDKMFDMFSPALDYQWHSTAQLLLVDIISVYSQSQIVDSDLLNCNALVQQIKGKQNVEKLISFITRPPGDNIQQQSSCIVYGVKLLTELIKHYTQSDEDDMVSQMSEGGGGGGGEFGAMTAPAPVIKRDPLNIDELIDVVCSNDTVVQLKNILQKPVGKLVPRDLSTGILIPFGGERLAVVEFFVNLLEAASGKIHSNLGTLANLASIQSMDSQQHENTKPAVFKLLLDNGILSIIMGYFFQFTWNNLLHNLVIQLLDNLFNAPLQYSEQLIISLFKDAELCKQICKANKQNQVSVAQPKSLRLGNMGHVTLMTEKVLRFISRHGGNSSSDDGDGKEPAQSELQQHIIAPLTNDEEWQEYVNGWYKDAELKNNRQFAGGKPVFIPSPLSAGMNGLTLSTPGNGNAQNTQLSSGEIDQQQAQSLSYFDMSSDQMARFMIQQVISDFPNRYGSTSAGSVDDDDDAGGWVDYQSFGLQNNNPSSLPRNNDDGNKNQVDQTRISIGEEDETADNDDDDDDSPGATNGQGKRQLKQNPADASNLQGKAFLDQLFGAPVLQTDLFAAIETSHNTTDISVDHITSVGTATSQNGNDSADSTTKEVVQESNDIADQVVGQVKDVKLPDKEDDRLNEDANQQDSDSVVSQKQDDGKKSTESNAQDQSSNINGE